MALVAEADRAAALRGLHEGLVADVARLRAAGVRIGRALLEIRRHWDSGALGATSFPIYCERMGLSPAEARDLVGLAEAAEADARVLERVAGGRLTPQKAALVNEVLKSPALQRPSEDLLALA